MGEVIGVIAIIFIALIIISWLYSGYKRVTDALNEHSNLKAKHKIELIKIDNEKTQLKIDNSTLTAKLKSKELTINALKNEIEYLAELTPFERFRVVKLKRNIDEEIKNLKLIKELFENDLDENDYNETKYQENQILEKINNDRILYVKFLEGKKK